MGPGGDPLRKSGERESRERVFCFDVEEGKFEVVASVSAVGWVDCHS